VNSSNEIPVPDRWQRTALTAVRCEVVPLQPRECQFRGQAVSPGGLLSIPAPSGTLRLFVEEALPDRDPTPAEMRVRFVGYASVIDQIRAGDRDRAQWDLDGRTAVITAVSGRRRVRGAVAVTLAQEATNVIGQVQAADEVATVDAVMRVGLDPSRTAWRYRNDLVRSGGPITFITRAYIARAIVLTITPPQPPDSGAGGGAGESR
jgi:hypothetical protein